MLASAQHLSRLQDMSAKQLLPPTIGNLGSTVGIIGASRVGRIVLDMLRPFSFEVLLATPDLSPADAFEPVRDAVQEWGPHHLHFLASGHLPPNPAELLGGDRMAKLVGELRNEYDKIIIDSPPVLPVADAALTRS